MFSLKNSHNTRLLLAVAILCLGWILFLVQAVYEGQSLSILRTVFSFAVQYGYVALILFLVILAGFILAIELRGILNNRLIDNEGLDTVEQVHPYLPNKRQIMLALLFAITLPFLFWTTVVKAQVLLGQSTGTFFFIKAIGKRASKKVPTEDIPALAAVSPFSPPPEPIAPSITASIGAIIKSIWILLSRNQHVRFTLMGLFVLMGWALFLLHSGGIANPQKLIRHIIALFVAYGYVAILVAFVVMAVSILIIELRGIKNMFHVEEESLDVIEFTHPYLPSKSQILVTILLAISLPFLAWSAVAQASAAVDSLNPISTYTYEEARSWQIANDGTNLSVTGKVYADTGATVPMTGVTVGVSLNGQAASTNAVDAGGQFSVTGLTMTGGTIVTLFVDGGTAAQKAVTVSLGSGSSMTGFTLIKNTLIVKSGTGASNSPVITSHHLAIAKLSNSSDADISNLFTTSSDNVTVAAFKRLALWNTGTVLSMSGTLTTPRLHLRYGTLRQGSNKFSITTALTQSGGTFSGGNQTIALTASAPFTLAGGTFQSTSSGFLVTGGTTVVQNFIHSGGTFANNSGTVVISITITAGMSIDVPTTENFYNLTVLGTAASRQMDIGAGDTLITNGTFTWTSGAIDTGTIDAKGDVVISATAGGDETTASTLRLVGTGTQTCTINAGAVVSKLVINNASATCGLSGAGTATFERDFTLTNGTFNGNSTDMTLSGLISPLIITGGTFNATTGTMQMNGNNWTHTAGGTFNHMNGTVAWSLTSATGPTADVSTTEDFYNLTIVGTSLTRELNIASGDKFIVNGLLNWTSGAIDTGWIDAKGDVIIGASAGGQDASSSVLRLVGTGTQTCTLNAGGAVSELYILNSGATCTGAGAGTFTFENNLLMNAGTFNGGSIDYIFPSNNGISFSLGGGTFNATTGTMNMSGSNWSHTGGTFNHNNGTISWNLIAVSGPTASPLINDTFNNLIINGGGTNRELNVSPGGTLTVLGNFIWNGGAIDGGTINAKGSVYINGAAAGKDVDVSTLKIGGTGVQNCTWNGGGAVSYLTIANPLANCIASGTGTITVENDLNMTGGTLNLNGSNLTVTSLFTVGTGTTLRLHGSETLTGGPDFIYKNSTIWYDESAQTRVLKTLNYQNLVISSTGSAIFRPKTVGQSIMGNLILSGGTLQVNGGQPLSVSGSWIQTGGTFTAGTGTVLLAGTGTTQTLKATSSFNNLKMNDGLVTYWKLDEETGSLVRDSSGNGNTGYPSDILGSSLLTPGRIQFYNRGSAYFDLGSQYWVNDATTSAKIARGSFSVSLWINPADIATESIFTDFEDTSGDTNSFDIRHHLGKIEFCVYNNTCQNITGITTLSNGTWYHITAVYNQATGAEELFVNGVREASALSVTRGIPSGFATYFTVGSDAFGSAPYKGNIDDVRVYNRALSRSEVAALYNGNQTTGSGIYVLQNALTVNGSLNIQAGTLDVSSSNYGVTVGGNFSNAAGFIKQAGTVTLNGSGNQTISGSTIFHNLTATTSTARTIFFDYIGRQSTSGSLILNGVSGNKLSIRSTKTGSGARILLDADATQNTTDLQYLDVKDSNATGGQQLVCATASEGCTDSGNNTNWSFVTSGYSISGKVFSNTGATTPLTGVTVAVSLNGAAAAGSAAVDAGGQFTIGGISAGSLTGGTIVTLYIDGATQKAVTVSHGSGGTMTGLTLILNSLVIQSGTGGTRLGSPITSSDLDTANNNADTDITSIYTNSSQNITIVSGKRLEIRKGGVYALGGTLTTSYLHMGALSGSLIQGANAITINTKYTQSGGTFLGGSSTIDLNGDFALTGGMYRSTSGNWTMAGSIYHTATGVFNNGSGTLVLDGLASNVNTDVPVSDTFHNISVNKGTGARVWTIFAGDTVIVKGTFTWANSLINSGTIDAKGDIIVSGGQGTGSCSEGTLLVDGTSTQSISITGGVSLPIVTINNANATMTISGGAGTTSIPQTFTLMNGTVNLGTQAVSITSTCNEGNLIISGGTFNSTTASLFIAKNFQHTAGIFNHNGGTVILGSSSAAITSTTTTPGIDIFNNLSINKGGTFNRTMTISGRVAALGNMIISDGTINSGVLEPRGNLTLLSQFDGGTSAITFSGTGTQILTNTGGTVTSGTWTIAKPAGVLTLSGGTALTLNTSGQDLFLTGGTLNLNGKNLTVNDIFTVGTGTTLRLHGSETITGGPDFLHRNSTVWYDASAGTNILKTMNYQNIVLGSTGSGIFRPKTVGQSIMGNLLLSGGTLQVNGGQPLSVSGSWIQTGGTFSGGTGTVLLAGSGTTQTLKATSSFNNLTLNNGLVGYWKLDEGTGATTIRNSTGTGNTAQLVNGPTWSTDMPSNIQFNDPKSVNFDGTDDYIQADQSAALKPTNAVTVSGWFKQSGAAVDIVGAAGWDAGSAKPYALDVDNAGSEAYSFAYFTGTNRSAVWATTVDTGWHHLVGTFDGSQLKASLYVDSILRATDTSPQSTLTYNSFGSKRFQIGSDGSTFFSGKIDDVRVYNRVLSTSEITALYNGNQSTGSGTYTLGSALTVAGNLNIQSGTLDASASNYDVSIAGNYANVGRFTKRSASVTFNGTGNQTITGSTVFNNFTATTSTARTIFFDYTGRQSASGSMALRGVSGNKLSIRSTKTGSGARILLDADVTQFSSDFAQLDVKDSNATGGQTLVCYTNTEGCTDSGNNTNWTIGGQTYSVTGHVYSDAGATTPMTGVTVAVALNGGISAGSAAVDAGGQFTVSGLTMTGGTVVTVFVDGGTSTQKAVTVSLGSGSSMTGFTLMKDTLIAKSGTGASYSPILTSHHLAIAKLSNSSDTDISSLFTMSSDNVTILTGKRLALWNTGSVLSMSGTLTASRLHIQAGTFRQGSNKVTINTTLTQSGGTFSGGNETIWMPTNSAFTLQGGTFLSTSSGFIVSSSWTHTGGGTFNHNNGTIRLPTSNVFFDVNTTETFYNLIDTIGAGSSLVIASGDTLVVNHTFTWNGGRINTGTVDVKGDMSASYLYSTDVIPGTGTITVTGTGTQTCTLNGGANMVALTINNPLATCTVVGSGGFYFNKAFTLQNGTFNGGSTPNLFSSSITISGGTFNASTASTRVAGDWTHTAGGTFNHNGSTVEFYTGQGTMDVNTTETFYNMIVNKGAGSSFIISSGDTATVNNIFTHSGGRLTTGIVEAKGDVRFGPNVDAAGSTAAMKFSGTGTQVLNIQGTVTAGTWTVAKPSGVLTLSGGALTLNTLGQDLIMTGGTLNLNGNNLTVNDIFTVGTGTTLRLHGSETITGGPDFLHRNSTVWYDASAGTNVLKTMNYRNLVISSTGSGIFRPKTTGQAIMGNLLLSGGTLQVNGGQPLSVSGSWIQTGGTFSGGTGTVLLAGTGTTQTLKATSSFANLRFNNGLAAYLKLDEGTGSLVVRDSSGTGTGGNLVNGPTWSADTPGAIQFFNPRTLHFDGTNDYVRMETPVGSLTPNMRSVSISFWFKNGRTTGSTDEMLLTKEENGGTNAGYHMLGNVSGGGTLKFQLTDGSATAQGTWTGVYDQAWHHAVGIANRETNRLIFYGDGVQKSSVNITSLGSLGSAAGYMMLGKDASSANPYMGYLDDIRIYNRALSFSEVTTLYSGIRSTGSGTYVLGADLTTTGNLTINSGTLDVSSSNYNVTVGGNWMNAGRFTKQTGTVTFNGSGNQTISGSTVFNNFSATTSTARTIFFDYTGRQSASGSMTLRGVSGNKLSIRSTKTGSGARILLDGDATQFTSDFAQLDVKDSNATGGQALVCYTNTEGCTDSGNNTNWTLGNLSYTITGKVYTNEGITSIASGRSVAVSINGAAAAGTATTDAGGQFTISNLTITGGSILTLYLDGATEKAVTVTTGSGGSMTGVNLYQDRLIVRSGTGTHISNGSPITSSMLDRANNNADTDITALYTNSALNLTIINGKTLYIWTGSTLSLGGTLAVGTSGVTSETHLNGNLIQGNNVLTFRGPYTQSGGTFTGSTGGSSIALTSTFKMTGGTFIPTTGTTTASNHFVASGGSTILPVGTLNMGGGATVSATLDVSSSVLNHLIVADSVGTLTVNGTVALSGSLTITSNFAMNGGTIAVTGNLSSTDTSNAGTTAILLTGSGNHTVSANGASGCFPSLTINTSGTVTLQDTIIVTGNWTYTAGTVVPGTSTVQFGAGLAINPIVTPGTMAFNNVTISISTGTLTQVGTIIVNGALTFTGLGAINGGMIAVAGNIISKDTSYTGTSTMLVNGTGSQIIGNVTNADYPDGQFKIAKPSGTVTLSGSLNLATTQDLAMTGGTFNLNGYNLTVNTALTMSGGTINGGAGTIDINGNFNLAGGTFTSTTGNMQVGKNWIHTAGGTFNPNNGTVIFDTSAGTTDVNITETFNNLQINKANLAQTLSAGDTLITTGTLTLTNGFVNGGTLEARGNVSLIFGFDGGTAPLNFTGTADQQFAGNNGLFASLVTINKASGAVTGSGTLDLNGGFTLASGTFNGTPGTMTLTGDWTHTDGGTFNANGGTVTFDGAASSVDVMGTETFYNLQISKTTTISQTISAGDTLITTGTLTFRDGKADGGTLEARGNVSLIFGFDGGTAPLNFTGTADQQFAGNNGLFASLVTINKASGAVTGSGTLDLNGGFTLASGTFNGTPGTMTLTGDWTHTDGGTFNANGGTVTFDGAASSVDVNGTETFNNLTMNHTTNTPRNIASGDNLIVSGTLTLRDGYFAGSNIDARGDVFLGVAYDGLNAASNTTLTLNGTTDQQLGANASTTARWGSGVIINKSSGIVTGSGTLFLGNLTMAAGTYNGSSNTMTLTTGLTITGGTFNEASGVIDLNGDMRLTGGTFTAPATTMTVAGSWIHTGGGTFNPNGGKVTFDATTSAADIILGLGSTETFYDLTLSQTLGTIRDIIYDNTVIVNGNLTLTVGSFSRGAFDVRGNLTESTNNFTNSPITFTGTADQLFTSIGTTATRTNGPITINKPSGSVTGSGNITLYGDFTLTSGTFVAPPITMNINSDWTHTGGTFNPNGGTISLNGVSSIIDVNGTETFNNLTIGQGFGTARTIASGDTLIVNGTFTPSSGMLAGAGNVDVYGNVTLNASYTGADSGTTLTFKGSADQLFTSFSQNSSGIKWGGTVVVDKPSGILTGSGVMHIGNFHLVSGTYISTPGRMIVDGDWIHSPGATFTHNNGTIHFNSFDGTIDVPGTETFYNVQNYGSEVYQKTIAEGDTIRILGYLWAANNLIGGAAQLYGDLLFFNVYPGGSTSLTFTGTGNQLITTSASTQKIGGLVTIDKASGTVTATGGVMRLGSGFTLVSGTFIAPNGPMNVGGNWNHTGGTFINSNGTVILNGTGSQTLLGSTAFNNLTATGSTARTIALDSTGRQSISGSLILQGISGNKLKIRSTQNGVAASLLLDGDTTQAVTDLSYLDVKDSNAAGGQKLVCYIDSEECADSGNDTNWTFSSNTTTTLVSSANPTNYGDSVTFTATVTPSTATGTITFYNGLAVLGSAILGHGSGSYTTSTLDSGTHYIAANYEGNAGNEPSLSLPVNQVVNQITTTTNLISDTNPSTYGDNVTFTASVTPSTATGTVSFMNGSDTLATVSVSHGSGSYTTSTLYAGSYSITAVFNGNDNYVTSTSSAVNQTVDRANAALTLLTDINPSTFGSTITFTMSVSPTSATGTLTFKDGSTTLGTSTIGHGSGSYSIDSLALGHHIITAIYDGNANIIGGTSDPIDQLVVSGTSSTALISDTNPTVYGDMVIFTASVTPTTATGSFAFKDGSTTIGSATISHGSGSFATADLFAGSHRITAVYSGNDNYGQSTSPIVTQVVTQTTSTVLLASLQNPGTFGADTIFTGTVTPSTATGTLIFKEGSTIIGTAIIGHGSGSTAVNTLGVGDHSITVVYSGDVNFTGDTSNTVVERILGTVSGTTWNDTNGNGVLDGSETSGLNGLSVTLAGTSSTGSIINVGTTTDTNGQFSFGAVVASDADGYTVTVNGGTTPAGYLLTRLQNSSGGNVLGGNSGLVNIAFGYVQASTVSGIVFVDENIDGIQNGSDTSFSGSILSLTGTSGTGGTITMTAVSDADGQYAFRNLPTAAGSGFILVITPPTGYTTTTSNSRIVYIPTGGQALVENFGYYIPTASSSSSSTATDNGGTVPSPTPPNNNGSCRGENCGPIIVQIVPESGSHGSSSSTQTAQGTGTFDSLAISDLINGIISGHVPQNDTFSIRPAAGRIDTTATTIIPLSKQAHDIAMSTIQHTANILDSAAQSIGNGISVAFTATHSAVTQIAARLNGASDTVASGINGALQTAFNTVRNTNGSIVAFSSAIGEGMMNVTHSINSTFVNVGQRTGSALSQIAGTFGSSGSATFSAIGHTWQQITAASHMTQLALFTQTSKTILDTGVRAFTAGKNVSSSLAQAQNKAATIAMDLSTRWTDTPAYGVYAGTKIAHTVTNQIESASDDTINSVSVAATNVQQSVHNIHNGVLRTFTNIRSGSERVLTAAKNAVPKTEVPEYANGPVPVEQRFRTTINGNGSGQNIIASLSLNVFDSFGFPQSNTPVVLFSTPKIAITNSGGIATFHNVETGTHHLEIHVSGGTVEKRDLILEPPSELSGVEKKQLDVVLPVIQVMVSEPTHAAAGGTGMPAYVWAILILFACSNIGWMAIMWERKSRPSVSTPTDTFEELQ